MQILRAQQLGGVLALATGVAVALCGCSARDVDKAATGTASPPPVAVFEVAKRVWPRMVRVQGTLLEDESAALGAKVAGRIEQVLVDLGTRVEQGQGIARLDAQDFDLRVRQAEAQVAQVRATLGLKGDAADESLDPQQAAPVLQELAVLEQARQNMDRAQRLTDKAVMTKEEVESRESALRVAEARYAAALNNVEEQRALLQLNRAALDLARQARADAEVKAPFAGVIAERRAAPGNYVNVGQTIATLVRVDPLRFRAAVPERAATGVAAGQPVRVFIEGAKEPLATEIARVSPALDVNSRALSIEADLPNADGRLRAGLFAEGDILVDARQEALAVPESSLVTFGGLEKVWLVKNDRAEPRPIRTGRRDGQFVEVLAGLEPGDLVVANGAEGVEGHVRAKKPGEDDHTRAAMLGN